MCIYIIAYYHPSKIKCNKKCAIISKIIAQNICFKYQKQGIVDVLLELNKALTGQRMDERIQLFNVETVDDLKMLETMTKNPGIRTGNVKKI